MIRPVLIAALLVAVSACAAQRQPVREGPPIPQRTIVETVPDGAKCRAVGRKARQDSLPAPLSIDPRALGFPVAVICEAEGYFPTTEILHPRPLPRVLEAAADRQPFSPMAARAAAPGADETSRVAGRLAVALRGTLFENPQARDAFYAALRERRDARWTALVREAERDCATPETSRAGASGNSPPEICRRAYRWLGEQRDADLRRLEIDRRRATFR